MQTFSRQQIESLVEEILTASGVKSPPIPIETLARYKGLPVVEQFMDSDVSGALVRVDGRGYGIAVNSTHAPVRKRFTVAHELAHHILGHKDSDHLDWGFTVLRRDGRSSEATDIQEIEANFFAASLLMPKSMLRADVELKRGFNGEVSLDEGDVLSLAKRYGVSKVAMQYRLMNLALLPFSE